jgi:iron complex outermembrane recepter protein
MLTSQGVAHEEGKMASFRVYLLAGAGLFAVAASPGMAQSVAPSAEDEGAIADIIVTARKVSESLQTTPVAVTALSGEALTKGSITNVSQLAQSTPGLTISSAVGQPGSATIFLRGQGSTDGLIAIDQAVGTYVDGVYSARSSGGAFELVDIGRVEVLHGPQGTLFGRNTTGGAISLISNRPTDKLEGSVRFDYGNYNAWLARGVINLPIACDTLAVRVAYQHRQHDGYGVNTILGNELAGEKSDYVRASLRIAPTGSRFSATIIGDYSDLRTTGQVVGLKSFTPSATLGALAGFCNGAFGPANQAACPVALPAGSSLATYVFGQNGNTNIYRVANNQASYGNALSKGVSGTLDYEFSDSVSLKSITAWRSIKSRASSDNDGTPYLLSGSLLTTDGNQIDQRQFSEELQLSGKAMDSKLSWIIGAFYFVENGTDRSQSNSLFPLNPPTGINDGTVRNKSYAGYGQLTYSVSDTVRLTGGLRYTSDRRDISLRNGSRSSAGVFTGGFKNPDGTPALVPGLTLDPSDPNRYNGSVTKGYVSYTASIDWEAGQGAFVYAKTSSANRSGGFNTRATAGGIPPVSFNPERVTDYEIGGKFDLLDRHVRLNVAGYYSKITNLQRNLVGVPVGGTLTAGAGNAGAAHVWGGEAELTVVPAKGLTLGATLGLTSPAYDSFINPIGGDDLRLTQFPYTPKQTFSLSGDYEIPISGLGTLNLHGDYSYHSKSYSLGLSNPAFTVAQNQVFQETASLPGYGLLNARIAFTLDRPNLEFAVFAKNITKKAYFTRLLAIENTPLGFTSYTAGDPQTYGISATFKF